MDWRQDAIAADFVSDAAKGDCTVGVRRTVCGGGAMLFALLGRYPRMRAIVSDANAKLINIYLAVRDTLPQLMAELGRLAAEWESADRPEMYYRIREEFNSSELSVEQAAQFIFLSKTCFNGLWRVNKHGKFNAAIGGSFPPILDCDTLMADNAVLQRCRVNCGSFAEVMPRARSFVYLDPPYRPVPGTAEHRYTADRFGDEGQRALKTYCDKLTALGHCVMVSNSDCGDGYFEELYQGYYVTKVQANRCINCNGKGRGPVGEVVITNYKPNVSLFE